MNACQWYHQHCGLASKHVRVHACIPHQWSPIGFTDWSVRKRNEKGTPFGVSLIRSQVLYRAAQPGKWTISNMYHRLHEPARHATQWWQGLAEKWFFFMKTFVAMLITFHNGNLPQTRTGSSWSVGCPTHVHTNLTAESSFKALG